MTNKVPGLCPDQNVASRLILKNLPKRITAERLKKVCSELGVVTDCQLKYTAAGKFRNFAFVGFQTVDEATAAKNHLHNTFIDSSKIQVEYCAKLNEAVKRLKPQSSRKVADGKEPQESAGSKHLIFENLPKNIKKKTLRNFLIPVKPLRIDISTDFPTSSSATITVAKSSEAKQLQKLDGRFFGGQKVTVAIKNDAQPRHSQATLDSVPAEIKDVRQQTSVIEDTGRLFVRNIPYVCTLPDIEQAFSVFGPLADVKLPLDAQTKQHKGYAMLSFVLPENALKAFGEMDGTVFNGRMLHIVAGEENKDDKREADEAERVQEGTSYKAKKSLKQSTTASLAHNWNSLFLSANAVADTLVDQLGTEKSQLLDAKSKSSLGVRMALGESQLVREAREFLLQNGVNLTCFENAKMKRSLTVILVKNLPAKTTPDELRLIFSKHGDLGRLIMPPSGISALIEYLNDEQAKKAFKILAYKKFKTTPLFLEWAPVDVFKVEHQQVTCSISQAEEKEKLKNDENEIEDSEGTVLFVKNLNFQTTDDELYKHFAKIGPLKYAQVARKKSPIDNTQILSMGYGFVAFKKKMHADQALKTLQRKPLQEFALELKISDRSFTDATNVSLKRKHDDNDTANKEGKSETKILVKNVPFQTSVKELQDLFKTFGQLKSVRLPKKTMGASSGGASGHRGFAFVDFCSASDARKAFEALGASTHLYGRRLVLQWAQQDETLEQLRAKAADMGDKKTAKRHKMMLDDLDAK